MFCAAQAPEDYNLAGERSASPEGRARSMSPLAAHRESMEFREEDVDKLNQMSQATSESPKVQRVSPKPSPRSSHESPKPSPRPRNASGHSHTSGNFVKKHP